MTTLQQAATLALSSGESICVTSGHCILTWPRGTCAGSLLHITTDTDIDSRRPLASTGQVTQPGQCLNGSNRFHTCELLQCCGCAVSAHHHSLLLTNELQQLAALREVAGVELVPVHHGGGRGGEAGGQQLQRVEHLVRHRDVRQPRQQLGEHLVVPAARHADGAQPGVGLPQAPENDALASKNIF